MLSNFIGTVAFSSGARRVLASSRPSAVWRPMSMVASDLSTSTVPRRKVKTILNGEDSTIGDEVVVKGWVRTARDQKAFTFIEVNDGSCMKGLQVVAKAEIDSYEEVKKLTTGCAVAVRGTIVESPGKGQKFEVSADAVQLVGECPGDSYPLQKKRASMEFLREKAHLRPRTNTIAAVARVRSQLAYATHNFFQGQGFQYLQTPLITASDCEGAGEMFRVSTLPSRISELPRREDDPDRVDFGRDFFGAEAFLTVSGQLNAETYACALGDVYTFGPTFRAENSQTTRHLAEFNMIEPEMAFADLADDMANAEAFVKHVVGHVLEHCAEDLQFFQQFFDKGLTARLERVRDQPFARVEYREAVALLQEEIAKDRSKWQYPDVEFGTDLQTEHERWLSEAKFGTATFVYNYPRGIKAFYMRDNEDGETVAAMDLLVPGVGELIGGSQREERLDVLLAKMAELGLDPEDYWWYLDLRRFGSVPHAGYGLGFERLVCYVTGVENIREAIAFPRYPGHAEF
uniref:asparagine--tRNA ligase n=1 Tax=Heterosigma akashiwo TaxID=2829 RepID=A0A7S4D5P5_HETAK